MLAVLSGTCLVQTSMRVYSLLGTDGLEHAEAGRLVLSLLMRDCTAQECSASSTDSRYPQQYAQVQRQEDAVEGAESHATSSGLYQNTAMS
jgi:hypothetical protein